MNENKKLKEILRISSDFANIKDIDILLERVLIEARNIVNADAGTIYTKEDALLNFSHAQNDTLQARLPQGEKLLYKSFSIMIDEYSIAGYVASTGEILNIPDVSKISDECPYSFDPEFDKKADYKTVSMLAVPLRFETEEIIGVLQIINARDEEGNIIPFSEDDALFIRHFASTASIAMKNARMTRALLLRMIHMAELRDPKETGAHVNRVAAYSVEIYERWAVDKGINREEIDINRDLLRMAAMLHDVGKIAISDTILKKPAKLTYEEFEVMKTHTTLGADLFIDKQSRFDEVASNIALSHHENWNGTGYPEHPKSEDISIFGRIVSVADVYDALSCKRVYKEAWKEEDVLAEIRKMSGIKFDPEVVDAFFKSLDVIKSLSEKYPDKT
ncbi:MAG: HD domain-containing protein [Candidatus Delongbacteria bacterium]|jgi:putative nucleotidyltransferase with HDIG domain|nr:HD domain-containing protein [Candidatus Delongbacteria bacterium]